MTTKTIRKRLSRLFSIKNTHPSQQATKRLSLAELENSLTDTRTLFKQQLSHIQALKKELQGFHSILQQRNKCVWQKQFDDSKRSLVITVGRTARRIDIIIYIPKEQLEIAAIYANPVEEGFLAMAQFYELAGFTLQIKAGMPTGALTYELGGYCPGQSLK